MDCTWNYFKIHLKLPQHGWSEGSIDDGDPRAKTSHKGKISDRGPKSCGSENRRALLIFIVLIFNFDIALNIKLLH